MLVDGLYFPDKIKNLQKAGSFDELKVSTGAPRYYKDKDGFWGFHLGNCGLTQEDWDEIQNLNSNRISKLKIVHVGNAVDSETSNTLWHFGIGNKAALEFLDVSHSPHLASIHGKQGATALQKLIATDCPQLTEIILEGDFPALTQVEAARGALTTFALSNAPRLRFLDISHNQLQTLTIPASCEKLEYIFASNNQLKIFEVEGSLPGLNILDLSHNQLEKLPKALEAAEALEEMNLSHNQIKDIEQWKAYIQRDFPLHWELGRGGIILEDNPLEEAVVSMLNEENPAEKKARLLEAIRLLEKGRNPEIRRAKLILLGNTGVGKTTLSDVLTGQNKSNPNNDGKSVSTHGINLFRYRIEGQEPPVEVQGFDFGGQDYYHSTHFAFFGYNAFYLLLWGNGQPHEVLSLNEDQDRRFPLNYWLGSVDFYDKRVGTPKEGEPATAKDIALHLLQNLPAGTSQRQELDNRSLKKHYPVIKSFEAFDVKTAKASKNKKNALKAWLNDQLNDYAKPIIISKIEAEIAEALRNQKKVLLTLPELQELHPEIQNNTQEQTERLAQNLNDRFEGYYIDALTLNRKIAEWQEGQKAETQAWIAQDTAFLVEQLPKKLIADLEQFTGWVYEILSAEIKQDGYFTKEEAAASLQAPEAKAEIEFILAFMVYHKIIFRVKQSDKEQYIAPHYLSPTPKVAEQLFLDSFEAPVVKYVFQAFFHVNIIVEVMLQYYHVLLQESKDGAWKYVMWKNKVILYEETPDLKDKKKLLLVDFEEEEEKIDGKTTQKIASIRLHRFIKNAVSDDFVREVMKFIEDQIPHYTHEKLIVTPFGNYLPAECLKQENTDSDGKNKGLVYHQNRIYRKADFKLFLENPDDYPNKRLFISYSSKQSDFMRRFEVHLAPLKQNGLIDVWHDRMITNGTLWDEKIQRELAATDIVVFLLSPDFLATQYVMTVEVPKAIEMKKQLFFVELMDCGWDRIEMLRQYQMGSNQKKLEKNIINLGGNPNDSAKWEEVISDLENTIRELKIEKPA